MLYLLRKFFLCNPCVVYPELTIEQQCRCILGDDYFEINGRPFCEYHAHRYMQRPPRPPPNRGAYNGGLKAPTPMPRVEKRRTRLMFMAGTDTPIPPGMGNRNQF